MLSKEIIRLEQNLRQQLTIYSELREIARLKQQALVKNLIPELNALVSREEMLILQAGKLEIERTDLAEKVAENSQVSLHELTLSRLASEYPQFVQLQRDFEVVTADIQEKHALNKMLLEQAIRIVDFSLHLLTRPVDSTYSRDNNQKEKEKQRTNRAMIVDKSV